jgi:hypothetical protein
VGAQEEHGWFGVADGSLRQCPRGKSLAGKTLGRHRQENSGASMSSHMAPNADPGQRPLDQTGSTYWSKTVFTPAA